MSTATSQRSKAIDIFLGAIDRVHRTNYSALGDSAREELFYSVDASPTHKTIYFCKPNYENGIADLCAMVRKVKRRHSTRSGRAYTVNVFSGAVTLVCFHKTCQARGGKKIIQMASVDESSDEDETSPWDDDEEEDEEEDEEQ